MTYSIFAVHLSDGAIATPWQIGGFVGAAVLFALGTWKLTEDWVPRIGVLTAAFFIGSTIHIKLAVLPTSVHLVLNGLVGVTLGRRAPLAVIVGLILQFLLLAHGGLWTLGLNACIIGIPAVVAGQLFPPLRRMGVPAFPLGCLLGAGAAGGAVVLNFLVLLVGGKDDWETLAKLVLLAHVPVVIVEGLMLGVVVRYLEKVKPELLGGRLNLKPPSEITQPGKSLQKGSPTAPDPHLQSPSAS